MNRHHLPEDVAIDVAILLRQINKQVEEKYLDFAVKFTHAKLIRDSNYLLSNVVGVEL